MYITNNIYSSIVYHGRNAPINHLIQLSILLDKLLHLECINNNQKYPICYSFVCQKSNILHIKRVYRIHIIHIYTRIPGCN